MCSHRLEQIERERNRHRARNISEEETALWHDNDSQDTGYFDFTHSLVIRLRFVSLVHTSLAPDLAFGFPSLRLLRLLY